MKNETRRRVRNLLRLLDKFATVEPSGDWTMHRWTTDTREILIHGRTFWAFKYIDRPIAGRVRMP
jgi:hypothetical protein